MRDADLAERVLSPRLRMVRAVFKQGKAITLSFQIHLDMLKQGEDVYYRSSSIAQSIYYYLCELCSAGLRRRSHLSEKGYGLFYGAVTSPYR